VQPVPPPAISVVIPTRDRAAQLLRCVRAVCAARRPAGGAEIVVVNDGGAPLPAAALRAAAVGVALRVLDQPGAGPAAARNRGAAAATGRILAFTDDDCEPGSDWLVALERGLERDPGVLVAGRAESLYPDNDWAAASQLLTDHLHRWYNRDPERGAFMTSNNLALTAATFATLGGFDASFPTAAAEDRELTERALRAGHRLVHLPGVVVGHAHRLTARTFLRQHYGYGRGAHRALLARRRAGGGMVLESPRFYTQLLRSPWREHRGLRALRLAVLLAASQVAHTAGFLRESLS
jgi:glycosyltransferase involved in cell wall biosynthesis